jgi:2-polyprenyl-3-methyl-5-hydroxy-6-metoxy-1,4-benzoquinol methylase
MPTDAALARFLDASPYKEPVDLKKLRFVYGQCVEHAHRTRRPTGDLSLLEFGCGVGGITLPLATLGGVVRAVDIDGADVAELTARARAQNFDNICATVQDALTFDDGRRYDVVVASEVFEHLVEPDRLAAVIARHTSPGGLLLVTTPNGFGPWEMWNSLKLVPRRWNWLRRALGKPAHDGGGREHEQRYTRRRLVALFASERFELSAFSNSDFVLTVFRPLRRSHRFGALDARLGDAVPHWMASGWYMAFKSQEH